MWGQHTHLIKITLIPLIIYISQTLLLGPITTITGHTNILLSYSLIGKSIRLIYETTSIDPHDKKH